MARNPAQRRNLFTGVADLSDGLRIGASESWVGDGKAWLADLVNPDGATILMERREIGPGFEHRPWVPCRRATFGNHFAVQLYASGFEYRARLVIPSGTQPARLTRRHMDSVADGILTRAVVTSLIEGELVGFGLPDDGLERYGDYQALVAAQGKAPLFFCYDPNPALQARFGGAWEKSGVDSRKLHVGDVEYLLSTAIATYGVSPVPIGPAAGEIGGVPIGRTGTGSLTPIPTNIGDNGLIFEEVNGEGSYVWQAPDDADAETQYELVVDGRLVYIGPATSFRQLTLPPPGVYGISVRVIRADGQFSPLVGRSITVEEGTPAAGGSSLAPPSGVLVTAVSATTFDVSWAASSPTTDVIGYRVTAAGAQVAQVTGTSARVNAAEGDRIAVRAYAADGRESAEATGTAPVFGASGGGGGTGQAPQPPTNVSASSVSGDPTSADVSFTESTTPDVNLYRVYNGTTLLSSGSSPPIRITGLTAGGTVTLNVTAAIGVNGTESAAGSTTYTAPSSGNTGGGSTGGSTGATLPPPTTIDAVAVDAEPGKADVNIGRPPRTSNDYSPEEWDSWTYQVFADGVLQEPAISGGYKRLNGLSTTAETVVGVRTYRASDGAFSTTITDTVTADGNGTGTGGSTGGTGTAATPTNPAVSNPTADSLTLTWTRPDETNIGSYEMLIQPLPSGATTSVATISPTDTYTFTGLSPSQQYRLIVRGVNGAGTTGDSASANGTTTASGSGGGSGTGTPADVDANSIAFSNVTSDSVTMTWTRPDETNITQYEMYAQPSGGSNALVATISPTNTYTFTGLTPDTSYTFGVRSRNSVNTGNTAVKAQATAAASGGGGGGGSSGGSLAKPTGFNSVAPPSDGNPTQADVNIGTPVDKTGITGYAFFLDGATTAHHTTTTPDSGYARLNGLTAGTTYTITCASVGANGARSAQPDISTTFTTGAASGGTGGTGGTGTPASVDTNTISFSNITPTAVTMNWTRPDETNISQYEMYAQPQGGTNVLVETIGLTSSYRFTGLTPDTNYTFGIRPRNTNNTGNTSVKAQATPASGSGTDGSSTLASPTGFNSVASPSDGNPTQADVNIGTPVDKTGITGYAFFLDGATTAHHTTTTPDSGYARLNGLTAGTTYTITCASVGTNGARSAPPDISTTFTTPAA